MTNVDIDSGTIGGCGVTVGSGKTLDVSAGTLTLRDDQISGDKIQGGTIDSVTLSGVAGLTASAYLDIGDHAFVFCNGLEELTLPGSIITLGEGVFANCKSLKSILLPESVTSLGDRAFTGCSSLENVTIPNSVIAIGKTPFWGCSNLNCVFVEDGNRIFFSSAGALLDKRENKLLD